MKRIWLRETTAFISAQRDYILMHQLIRKYFKPAEMCLADWMCTREYKDLIKKMTGPISARKRQADKWLRELEKRKTD